MKKDYSIVQMEIFTFSINSLLSTYMNSDKNKNNNNVKIQFNVCMDNRDDDETYIYLLNVMMVHSYILL